MGSAALARCALRGVRALGVEQFARGHTLGASSGKTRIIRQAYYEDAAYVPLLLRAYELWNDLERRANTELVRTCGLLMCGMESSEVIAGSLRAARAYDLPIECWDAADVRARYPSLLLADDEVGVFERLGGAVFSERAVDAHLGVAEKAGAEMRFETSVQAWTSDGTRVTADLSDGSRVEAAALLLTLGPWIGRAFERLGIALEIQRNVQVWFAPSTRAYDASAFPAFLVDRPSYPAPLYGFPDFGDGVKAAFHAHGATTTATELDRSLDRAHDVAPVARALETWMPGAGAGYRDGKACMYALTADRNFVIDRHPDFQNVVIAGGFSGHGFKFASVVGEICAGLAIDGATEHDIGFLSASREALRSSV